MQLLLSGNSYSQLPLLTEIDLSATHKLRCLVIALLACALQGDRVARNVEFMNRHLSVCVFLDTGMYDEGCSFTQPETLSGLQKLLQQHSQLQRLAPVITETTHPPSPLQFAFTYGTGNAVRRTSPMTDGIP